MKKTSIAYFTIFVFFFFNAVHAQKLVNLDSTNSIQYSEKDLVSFFNSVETLNIAPLLKVIPEKLNKIFKNQTSLKRKISSINFKKLMDVIESKEMEVKLATALFGKTNVNFGKSKENSIGFTFYSFDEDKTNFKEFAIYFTESHELFFIKNQKVIAKHLIKTKLFPDLQFYKDSDGKTVVYYDYELERGSGIWQSNYFFYKIDGEKMEPVLNQIHQSNLNGNWSSRNFSLESTIESTSPLTFKIDYEVSFLNQEKEKKFINDSTLLQYFWNDKIQQLEGNFAASKLNEAQLASFCTEGSDLLFLKSFYPTIKNNLQDSTLKEATLIFLNEVKNILSYRN